MEESERQHAPAAKAPAPTSSAPAHGAPVPTTAVDPKVFMNGQVPTKTNPATQANEDEARALDAAFNRAAFLLRKAASRDDHAGLAVEIDLEDLVSQFKHCLATGTRKFFEQGLVEFSGAANALQASRSKDVTDIQTRLTYMRNQLQWDRMPETHGISAKSNEDFDEEAVVSRLHALESRLVQLGAVSRGSDAKEVTTSIAEALEHANFIIAVDLRPRNKGKLKKLDTAFAKVSGVFAALYSEPNLNGRLGELNVQINTLRMKYESATRKRVEKAKKH